MTDPHRPPFPADHVPHRASDSHYRARRIEAWLRAMVPVLAGIVAFAAALVLVTMTGAMR